jgi:hypothetical protein
LRRSHSDLLGSPQEPGWGASGNNGGQLNPGLKLDPDTIEAAFDRRGRATAVDQELDLLVDD